MKGCTQYPQGEGVRKKFEETKAIRRIRRHLRLVLWAGNDENEIPGELDISDESYSNYYLLINCLWNWISI
jgi:hypothetical protein